MRSDPPSIAASPPIPLGDAAVPLATRRSLWPPGGPFGHPAVPLAPRWSLWPPGGPFGHAAVPLATRRSLWPRGGPFGHAAVPLATRRSLWPRGGPFGHPAVPLATTAVLGARFVGYFGRSRGQRARGVAKDAGRDAPGEARVAAVHRCGNAYGPGRVKPPVSETAIRLPRHADPAAAARRPVDGVEVIVWSSRGAGGQRLNHKLRAVGKPLAGSRPPASRPATRGRGVPAKQSRVTGRRPPVDARNRKCAP